MFSTFSTSIFKSINAHWILLVLTVLWFFQTLNPSITGVRNAIDKSLTERDANIDKFCTHLDKDIAELGKEVKEVKQEAQVMGNKNSL